jgi:hypothetical protein
MSIVTFSPAGTPASVDEDVITVDWEEVSASEVESKLVFVVVVATVDDLEERRLVVASFLAMEDVLGKRYSYVCARMMLSSFSGGQYSIQ